MATLVVSNDQEVAVLQAAVVACSQTAVMSHDGDIVKSFVQES